LKVKIGSGTPVEGARIEVDGPVVKLWANAKGGRLILAYHLHPGEQVRGNVMDGEECYEINQ